MRICDINAWVENVEKARFCLPETSEAYEAEDMIDLIVSMIKEISLDRLTTVGEIKNLQSEVKSRLLEFHIYI